MSIDHYHRFMQRQRERQWLARTSQIPAFESYDATEDLGSVRLLWLQAALRARRVTDTEG